MRMLNREFALALVAALKASGWTTFLPDGPLPNPLEMRFIEPEKPRLLVYARQLTPQSSATSDHGRPPDELHAQMIFEGTNPSGEESFLRFEDGMSTVLFGYYKVERGYVIAAFDPSKHQMYRYSKSLQVKDWRIEQALQEGIAFHPRINGEMVVLFHVDQIVFYLSMADEFHQLSPESVAEVLDRSFVSDEYQRRSPSSDVDTAPILEAQEREIRILEVSQRIRDHNFRRGIEAVYERCAICGFQYDYVLDAAHIVPVAQGGTDTYENGLGLCPNCHRMYDKGLILVDGNFQIHINTRFAEEYDQIGRAGSLADLQKAIRESLWLPENQEYHPSPDNLRRIFEARR